MNDALSQTKTVAVTGATGLLGRHLCDYLAGRGWRVRALVRDPSKYPFSEKGIRTYRCSLPDTMDPGALESTDFLVHCAYMTRFTNLEEAKKVNEDGMAMVLREARKAGVRQFVFISSRAARPNATSYYAQSKYRLESMLDTSRDLIVRPGLILARDGGLFYRIVNQVKKLPLVPVFGGGRQTLNTIHIEDICKILEWALDKEIHGVITAAEPEGITMRELLRLVLEELGQNKMIVSVPGRPIMWLLQFLELLNLKLPVSSENLRGLLNREDMGAACSDIVVQSGIPIRQARDSIKSLVPTLQ